jgi:hypothetical protein
MRFDSLKLLSLGSVIFIVLTVYFSTTLIGQWSEVIFTKKTIIFLLAAYAIFLSGYAIILLFLYFVYVFQYGTIHLVNHVFKKNYGTWTFLQITHYILFLFPRTGFDWASMKTLIVILLIALVGLLPAIIWCYTHTKKNTITLREHRKEAYRVSIMTYVASLLTMLLFVVQYYDFHMVPPDT